MDIKPLVIRQERYVAPILILLIVASLVGNIYWVFNSIAIKGADVPNHLLGSVEMYYKLTDSVSNLNNDDPGKKALALMNLTREPLPHIGEQHPVLAYFITALFYVVFGKALVVAKLSNVLYLLILLITVYLISKMIFSRFAGMIAAYLVVMYPIVFESCRQYGLDLPLTAFVALSILLLAKTSNFSNMAYSVALGICMGIGMLIKIQLVLFIIGPAMYVIYASLCKKGDKKIFIWRNILISLTIAVLIAMLWWFAHINKGIYSVINHMNRNDAGVSDLMPDMDTLFKFLKGAATSSMGLPGFILAGYSLVYIFKAGIKEKYIYLLWITVPVLLLSGAFFILKLFDSFHISRYLMPVLPAIAIISAGAIAGIGNRIGKFVVLIFMVIYFPFQYYLLTFASPGIRKACYGHEDYPPSWGMPSYKDKYMIPLFGGSNFGDYMNRYDKFMTDKLINVFKEENIISRTTIMVISFYYDAPLTFDIRYRFKAENRDFEILDFCDMARVLDTEYEYVKYIVVKAPSSIVKFDWPDRDVFDYNLGISNERKLYNKLKKTDLMDSLLGKFYANMGSYKFMCKIDTGLGYNWIIYKVDLKLPRR